MPALVENCIFANNEVGVLAGAYGEDSDLRNCTITGCTSVAVACLGAAMRISGCQIVNNTGWDCVDAEDASIDLLDCVIRGYYDHGDTPYLPMAALHLAGGTASIRRCTITDNVGGVVCAAGSDDCGPTVSLSDSILWNNPGTPLLSEAAATAVSFEASYSLIEGGFPGTGVLDLDPKLLSNGRLSPDSPCINAGDPAFTDAPDQTDIDGQPRVLAGRVDIGADEFTTPGDANADEAVNVADLQVLVAAWGTAFGDPGYRTCADLDGDGHVNIGDLQLLVTNWGSH